MPVYRIHICAGRGQVFGIHVGLIPVTFIDDITRYKSDVTADGCLDGIFCSPAVTSDSILRVTRDIGTSVYEAKLMSNRWWNVRDSSCVLSINIYLMSLETRLKL